MCHVVRGKSGNRFHVTELPVMRPNSVHRGELERNITVVRSFVIRVQKRRALFGSSEVHAMATGAVSFEQLFTQSGIGHQARAWLGDHPALSMGGQANGEYRCQDSDSSNRSGLQFQHVSLLLLVGEKGFGNCLQAGITDCLFGQNHDHRRPVVAPSSRNAAVPSHELLRYFSAKRENCLEDVPAMKSRVSSGRHF